MLIAQALAEHGALSGLSAAFKSALYQVETFIGGLDMKEYFFIGVAAVVLYMVFGKRG